MFVSLTPGDPTLWSGVMFVRKGPYIDAVLRFQISFPDVYPRLPPLVTFSTDIFHPLITPLSNYTYTTDIQDNGTVSASDSERLPPGGFSLRHGFPDWFGRKNRAVSGGGRAQTPTRPRLGMDSAGTTPDSTPTPAGGEPAYMRTGPPEVATYDVLEYILSTFDDEEVLDSLPLEAAGNPGAWHAWRTHRKTKGKVYDDEPAQAMGEEERLQRSATGIRQPGDWNWDGVWEDRVKKNVAASLSEPVLYGGVSGADDVIGFLPLEDSVVETIKGNLMRTLGVAK
ncbi:hypothetical protein jhhlp_003645 [Lomentospora prolificans]|uniref:UBC core domain-containing protein n=1 Tax=Lomentospora prolificans TaxID=41688 RepID=A0A2N3N9I0_9PEZI|nr:hypothetical protein jhhlp_003645 [Lomentospora prolificans]